MPITLTCPQCQATQTVPDGATGPTRCPSCRAEFAPGPDRPTARARAKGRGRLWAIGLILLAGAGLAAYWYIDLSTPTDFTEPDGVFSARFPDPPEAETLSEANPLALRWGEQLYRARARGKDYSVAVLTGMNAGDQPYGPATRDDHINGAIVILLTNEDGRLLTDRPAAHEGHPAREVVFVRRGDGRLIALRCLAGERHILRMAVIGRGDRDRPTDFLDRAGEFFDGVHVGAGFGPPIVDAPTAVSAADLAAAYRADARAADAKYKGRWVRVTGPVHTAAKGGTEFQMGAAEGVVVVKRAPRARRTVPVRGPGTTVTVTGRCGGLDARAATGPRVLLEDAIVENRGRPSK